MPKLFITFALALCLISPGKVMAEVPLPGPWVDVGTRDGIDIQSRTYSMQGVNTGIEYRARNRRSGEVCFGIKNRTPDNVLDLSDDGEETLPPNGRWVFIGGFRRADVWIDGNGLLQSGGYSRISVRFWDRKEPCASRQASGTWTPSKNFDSSDPKGPGSLSQRYHILVKNGCESTIRVAARAFQRDGAGYNIGLRELKRGKSWMLGIGADGRPQVFAGERYFIHYEYKKGGKWLRVQNTGYSFALGGRHDSGRRDFARVTAEPERISVSTKKTLIGDTPGRWQKYMGSTTHKTDVVTITCK